MESLSSQGCKVNLCSDGVEAWEYLKDREHGFDILIADLSMPRLTGVDLVKRLREHGDSLPVVLCAGFKDIVDRQVIGELENVECLEKPVRLEQLADQLKGLLLTIQSVSSCQ
jgi:DNA-binding response OmpR family regulator